MNVMDYRHRFVCHAAMAQFHWNFWPRKKKFSVMNLGRWSCKPPRLGFVQLSSSIWATQRKHKQINTRQWQAELYLGKCLLKEDTQKTAADQTSPCLQCAARQTQNQLHMAALYNYHSRWTPYSGSGTSANTERQQWVPSSCKDNISELLKLDGQVGKVRETLTLTTLGSWYNLAATNIKPQHELKASIAPLTFNWIH